MKINAIPSKEQMIDMENLYNITEPKVQGKLSDVDIFGNVEYVSANTAMGMLGLSRHNFAKLADKGLIVKHLVEGKTVFDRDDIENFLQTQECKNLINGHIDERNTLNDLTGKEWIPETKSYFFQKGLGKDHPEAQIEKQHPAPFSYQDVEKLILFFTKQQMTVLDPFGGIGSTAKACEKTHRKCISIELSQKYHDLSVKRLETEVGTGASGHHCFVNGDSCKLLPTLETGSVDFVVTSPPYWGILHKQDQKVKKNRVENNLDTVYSDDPRDLGNVPNYCDFLEILCRDVFLQCARTLRRNKYMAIIVSDFRNKGDFVSFHSDLISKLNRSEIQDGGVLSLQGVKILIQNHKSLHPYGYPFSYVENIHHQYVLIFKKK